MIDLLPDENYLTFALDFPNAAPSLNDTPWFIKTFEGHGVSVERIGLGLFRSTIGFQIGGTLYKPVSWYRTFSGDIWGAVANVAIKSGGNGHYYEYHMLQNIQLVLDNPDSMFEFTSFRGLYEGGWRATIIDVPTSRL